MNPLIRTVRSAILLAVLCGSAQVYAQTETSGSLVPGRALFNTACSPCHGVHKEIIGPMLASIPKKHSREWLGRFIKNSQEVIISGDVYARELFDRYHHQVMPSFNNFSDDEIDDLLLYIESESIHPAETVDLDIDVMQNGGGQIIHGKTLFQNQCLTCHHIQDEIFGPALGSETKRRSQKWLTHFIKNSADVIGSGDLYAVDLLRRYDNKTMVNMEFLTDDDVGSILAYIEFASSSGSAKAGVNGRTQPRGSDRLYIVPLETNIASGRSFRWLMLAPAFAAISILLLLGSRLVRGAGREQKGVV